MVQPRKQPGDNMNGTGKSSSMSFQRKDGADGRAGSSTARGDGKAQNGTRSGFRTDTAISNNRAGAERPLQRWVPDAPAEMDGSLESSSKPGGWDQFAENERLFGLKTDYNENYYTTAIDKSHPKYSERLAAADRQAREIEKTAPTTAHVAEERVMDNAGGDDQGEDEEDKYSGVRRQQDFPPLSSNRDNKYTPPARRAPTGHTTVTGAPVDPAIISSQIKVVPKKQGQAKAEDTKTTPTAATRPAPPVAVPQVKTPEPKADAKASVKHSDTKSTDAKANSATKSAEPAKTTSESASSSTTKVPSGSSTTLRASATPGRAALSPSGKATTSTTSSSAANSPAPPSVTENVENALLKDFKDFASQQRLHAEKARHNKMKADAQSKLQELKKFANSFKLSTPVPVDLISIIAKDPAKQKQIQEKARQNVEELAKTKTETKAKDTAAAASAAATAAAKAATATAGSTAPSAGGSATTAASSTPTGTHVGSNTGASTDKPAASNARQSGSVYNTHNSSPAGVPNRHPNSRQPYMQQGGYRQQSQPYRGDRSGAPHMQQGHTGNLAERIRNSDQNRYSKGQPPHGQQHFNHPPTGPANPIDPNYARRLSGVPPGAHLASQKLNPTIHEFRPSPFAASFNPTGPSAGSSPRSAVNNVAESSHPTATASTAPTVITASSPRIIAGALIRRKTNAVDPKKCDILSHAKTVKPPENRHWDDNDGLRPPFDTQPIWRQHLDNEKEDSTMHLTYKDYFERMAFGAAAMATPIQGHALPHGMPQMAHHQLPLHMQQHGGHMGPRPSPHMPPVPMHTGANGPHGHVPHGSFNGSDDHRMMHSQSAQSFASPRLATVPMYPPQVGTTPQMAYNQPIMQQFIPGAPQMNQFRNFSNGPQQYIAPQSGPMMSMLPPQQHFVAVPGGMPMYPQFVAPPGTPGGVAPQHMGGANGYPSPGRPPAAPMMVQQGSQQGQPMYAMSPSMQYQQPAFGQGAKVPMRGSYNNPGAQQFGTSPQHPHQYGPPHRNGSGSYGGKNYQNHNHNSHQGPPPHQASHGGPTPTAQQGRAGGDGPEEAK